VSKIAKGISKVAGIAAGVLSFIAPPLAAPFAAISSAAGAIAQLTAKPPRSVLTLDDYTIGPSTPFPYVMGRSKVYGNLVHQESHGSDREDIPNPWMTQTFVYSGAGPVQSIDSILVNNNPVTFASLGGIANGYYDKYMRHDNRLGNTPATALNTNAGGFSHWGSGHKLSGMCAAQFSMLLDSDETHYSGGPPKFSLVIRGVKCYDPRLDDTIAGGSGSHRIGQEATYTYSQNPPLHALTYVFGRYQNGSHVCGGGLPVDAIDIPSFIEAANIADANGWTLGGVVYENGEDGEIWNNLKLILEASACVPTNDGGILRVISTSPKVSLDTITEADLEGPLSVPGVKQRRVGFNTVIPKYRSEANDWAYVESESIAISALVTLHGEERLREQPFSLVTAASQGAQLSIYRAFESVEISGLSMLVGRRFLNYNIGDAMDLDLAQFGLTGQAIITQTTERVDTGQVELVLKTEHSDKHTTALPQTGTAPPHQQTALPRHFDEAYNYRFAEVSADVTAIIEGDVSLDDVVITGRGSIVNELDSQAGNVVSASNSSGFTAMATPSPVQASANDGNAATTPTVNVSLTNGVAPFTYSWERQSGDVLTIGTPNDAGTTFTGTPGIDEILSGVYKCTITDSNTAGAETISVLVSVTIYDITSTSSGGFGFF